MGNLTQGISAEARLAMRELTNQVFGTYAKPGPARRTLARMGAEIAGGVRRPAGLWVLTVVLLASPALSCPGAAVPRGRSVTRAA
jgi:hypothetical protein